MKITQNGFTLTVLFGFVASAWGSDIQRIETELAIPDFSYAGYHRSERAIPVVAGPIFDVTQFGAVADDGKSDNEAIQRAIHAAEKKGGGVVYFPKGRFELNEKGSLDRLKITSSHIVLRGSGAEENGTVLAMSQPLEPPAPIKLWGSPYVIEISAPNGKAKGVKIVKDVARGERDIQVANAAALKADQWISLSLTDNSPALLASELAGFQKVDPRWTSIVQKGIQVDERHQIEAVHGNKIVLKTPVLKAIDHRYQWTVIPFAPLTEIGVEHLRFVGGWKDSFVHHRSWMDDGGYSILKLSNVVNSWVRNCVFVDVNRASTINGSAQITVIDSRIEGTPGHDAICFQASSFCLMARVDDRASQWHSVGIANESIGTVLLRCTWNDKTCFESHSSQPRHTLVDSCEGAFLSGHGGGAVVNLPTHLEGLVVWNHLKTNPPLYDFQFEPLNETYWRMLQPIIVGMHGTEITFRAGQSRVVSNGTAIAEGSLYDYQVKRRLGEMPTDLRHKK